MHRHECPICGTIWEHGGDCCFSKEAHQCPTQGCEGVQYWHYLGDNSPVFVQNCARAEQVYGVRYEVKEVIILIPPQKNKV